MHLQRRRARPNMSPSTKGRPGKVRSLLTDAPARVHLGARHRPAPDPGTRGHAQPTPCTRTRSALPPDLYFSVTPLGVQSVTNAFIFISTPSLARAPPRSYGRARRTEGCRHRPPDERAFVGSMCQEPFSVRGESRICLGHLRRSVDLRSTTTKVRSLPTSGRVGLNLGQLERAENTRAARARRRWSSCPVRTLR